MSSSRWKINSTIVFDDDPREQTLARRIATYLSDFRWYNPSIALEDVHQVTAPTDEEEKDSITQVSPPNLKVAWEYFEHQILPRRLADGSSATNVNSAKYQRAEPGTKEVRTKLYPVWDTPLDDMGDFGIGVGLYFVTLRYFSIMCLMAGIINIPNMIYLWSDAEGASYAGPTRSNATNILRSSLACTKTEWKPCPTCTNTTDYDKTFLYRVGFDEEGNGFILQNACELNRMFGYVALACIVFVLIAVYNFMRIQYNKKHEIDLSEQTSSDYSIQITNPPPDAKDPEQWKTFFQDNFPGTHVTVCTISVDNEEMVNLLIRRRRLLLQLENSLPRDVGLNPKNLDAVLDKAANPGCFSKFLCCAKNTDVTIEMIKEIDEELKELAKKDYDASAVFITFEKEENQKRVLEGMVVPKARKDWVNEKLKFEGKVLNVVEPGEPMSIRWADLDETALIRVLQKFFTFLLAALLIAGNTYLIVLADRDSPKSVAITIIVLNQITPRLVRLITSFESHRNEGTYASSVYLKVTAIRWANTVIVLWILSPFTDVLRNGEYLLSKVTAVLVAEIVQRPIFQLGDIVGNIKRHLLAPRALDQRRMNMSFNSSSYAIGERYTEITRVLFLTFFYCTLIPGAFFFASAIFVVYYWMDKFCILRSWKQAPRINASISTVSMYVFLVTVVAYAVMASFSIAQFPFDNACMDEDNSVGAGFYKITTLDGEETFNVTVGNNASPLKLCSQDMFRYKDTSFPALSNFQPEGSKWMTEDQEHLTILFGWGSIAVLGIVSTTFLFYFIRDKILPLFIAIYFGKEEGFGTKTFSEDGSIYAYVPQVLIPGYIYPALLCEIDNSYNGLVGWNDPNNEGYDHHNMIYDVDERSDSAFHIIKKWEP